MFEEVLFKLALAAFLFYCGYYYDSLPQAQNEELYSNWHRRADWTDDDLNWRPPGGFRDRSWPTR